jgi:CHASE3 domain sensor protein
VVVPHTLNQNAKASARFCVVIALFAYILIVVTIPIVCAVFGTVWAEWRQGENDRKG